MFEVNIAEKNNQYLRVFRKNNALVAETAPFP